MKGPNQSGNHRSGRDSFNFREINLNSLCANERTLIPYALGDLGVLLCSCCTQGYHLGRHL